MARDWPEPIEYLLDVPLVTSHLRRAMEITSTTRPTLESLRRCVSMFCWHSWRFCTAASFSSMFPSVWRKRTSTFSLFSSSRWLASQYWTWVGTRDSHLLHSSLSLGAQLWSLLSDHNPEQVVLQTSRHWGKVDQSEMALKTTREGDGAALGRQIEAEVGVKGDRSDAHLEEGQTWMLPY